MKRLFPLTFLVLLLCWSLAAASDTPTSSSPNVSYMPGSLTSDFIAIQPSEQISNASLNFRQLSDIPSYPTPLVETCPTGTMFGQNPYAPTDSWWFGTADLSLGYIRYESFTVSDDICDVHWWGLSLYWNGTGWENCTDEAMAFDVIFYPDAGGAPDVNNPSCTYTDIVPTMVATGDVFSGFPGYRYSIDDLVNCCALQSGWISIQGTSVGSPNDCVFLWSGALTGDGVSYIDDGDSLYVEPEGQDLAICLTPAGIVPDSGACCNDANGACVDNVLQSECPSPARWVANTLCADLQPPCGTILGACCDDQGSCTQTEEQDCQGVIWLSGVACDPNPCPPAPPCTLSCPVNGIPEGEPDCYDGYVDNFNGGCNSSPSVFSTISIGDTICGKAGDYVTNDSLRRDTDWYQLNTTTDNMLYYYGTAEFDLQLLIIDAGSGDCVDYSIVASTTVPACSTGVISTAVCPGKTYWLWAGENDADLVACGSDYQIWTELGAPATGACCVATNCVSTTTLCECDALDGNWYIGETCPDFQCPIIVDCAGAAYSNGAPTGGAIGSQCDIVYPFAAGTADDFVLPGSDPVTLQYVVSWVWFWNSDPLSTPADMEGVNVTIYANDPDNNAPGGKPLHPPDSSCTHVELITDGIVYTTHIPQGGYGYLSDDTNVWRLMMPVDVTLDAGVTYWLEIEPVLQFTPTGQVGPVPSDIQQGAGAMQIFELLGTDVWTTVDPLADYAFCLLAEGGGACDYVTGDVNGSNSYNGLDITYGVAFFKGGPDPMCPACPPCSDFFYCGDVNGSCSYNGLDITYGVAYFKGGAGPIPCSDCPPNP